LIWWSRRSDERFRHGQPILVATIAVAIAIQESCAHPRGAGSLAAAAVQRYDRAHARGRLRVTVTPMQIAVALMALAAAAGPCWCCFAQSRFGREWRAFATIPARRPCSRRARPARRLTFVLAACWRGSPDGSSRSITAT